MSRGPPRDKDPERPRTPAPSPPPPQRDATPELIEALRAAGDMLEAVLREARLYAGARRARTSSPGSRAPYKVLVVDDDENTRVLYVEALSAAGFDPSSAAGAAEALRLVKVVRPDVIVLDYAMPEIDGAQAVRLLEEDPRTQGVPVVMVTAYIEQVPAETRRRCSAVIPKPCGPDELAYLLRLVIDARAQV